MATSLQRNTNRTRPTKSAGAKAKRSKVQRRRLVALGLDEATVFLYWISTIHNRSKLAVYKQNSGNTWV